MKRRGGKSDVTDGDILDENEDDNDDEDYVGGDDDSGDSGGREKKESQRPRMLESRHAPRREGLSER